MMKMMMMRVCRRLERGTTIKMVNQHCVLSTSSSSSAAAVELEQGLMSHQTQANSNWGTFNMFNIMKTPWNYFTHELLHDSLSSEAALHFNVSHCGHIWWQVVRRKCSADRCRTCGYAPWIHHSPRWKQLFLQGWLDIYRIFSFENIGYFRFLWSFYIS